MSGHQHGQGHGHRHGAGPGSGNTGGSGHGGAGGSGHAGHGNGHDHGHGHGHGTDIDWEVMAAQLENGAELHLPVLREIAEHLGTLPAPGHRVRRILDIGSGPGVMTCVLAEAFPEAEVVAVDGAPGLLAQTLKRAGRLGLGDRVTVRQAELPAGLAGLGAADLVWSSKAVHHLGDQQGALDALAGLLRPGGVLAVAEGGLPVRFLPRDIGTGRPGLQARLDALLEEWFDRMRTELPGSVGVVEDWPAMLTRAGLTRAGAFTRLLDLPAPLSAPGRDFVRGQLERLREGADELLEPQDRATLDLLLDDAAPEGIRQRPDAFLLSATTVHAGVRP